MSTLLENDVERVYQDGLDGLAEIVRQAFWTEAPVTQVNEALRLLREGVLTGEVKRILVVNRHYRSGDWCSYQGVLHTQDDEDPDEDVHLPWSITGLLEDGEEVEIVVRRTGRKLTTRWERTEPHHYAPTENPTQRGCPRCRQLAEKHDG